MKTLIVNILCAFVPSKNLRIKLRNITKNKGRNNKVIIVKDEKEYVNSWLKVPNGLKIRMIGNDNTIRLHFPIYFKKSSIKLECNGGNVEIGANCHLEELSIQIGKGQNPSCKICSNTSTGSCIIVIRGSSHLIIENDCMISFNVLIRTTDSHYIYNKDNRHIINKQKQPLIIGQHTWIGEKVCITKNAVIPANTIIGLASVVSGKFKEEYTCIAGNPAKIIKRNVVWSNELES